ncbi:transposable element Tcb2 transposase [Trichonephila clavipes]|nr:transposable element Tcb2 transposase [Trichonephila clavipes]
MATRNHLDDFRRGRLIENLEEIPSLTSVAEEFGINKNVISCPWKAFQIIFTDVRNIGGGLSRKTTSVDNLYMDHVGKRASKRHGSAAVYRNREKVLRFTVVRHHHKGGLLTRRPESCIPLKVGYWQYCLEWFKRHKN